MWILPRAERESTAGSGRGSTRWGVERGGRYGQRESDRVWGEMRKQESKEGRALPAARPRYTIGGGGTCAGKKGQALAAAAGMHLESRLFASAKAGRGGVDRAPGPTVARCPRSPPPCPGRAALIGRRTRSFEGRTDIRTYTGAKRQCTCVALMPLEWTRRFDRSGVSSSSVFPHERAGRPAGYSVFFSFATQRAGPWPGSIFPGTVEPRA
jgi:hypothetical protein